MTPEQFRERMAKVAELAGGDTEGAHSLADELLCDALIDAGFAEGVQVFRKMDKWYA